MLPHGCYLSLSLSRALSLMHICINKNISILKIDIYVCIYLYIYTCVCVLCKACIHFCIPTYVHACMHACMHAYSTTVTYISTCTHTHTLTCVIRPANRRGQNSASGLNKGFSVPHPFAFEHAHVEQGRPEIRICSCCIHTLREFECSGHVGCSASC